MYCITCGTQNPEHTRYCNRCGVNLETLRNAATGQLTLPPASALNSRHVTSILVVSTLLGLGGLLLLLGCLIAVASADSADRHQIAPAAVMIGMLAIGAMGFIIWRLLKMIPTAAAVPAPEPPALHRHVPPIPTPQSLPSAVRPDVIPSVVEHTTHNLPHYSPPREPER
jgi:hypothetical protein